MANNYSLFSQELHFQNEEELDWFVKLYEELRHISEHGGATEEPGGLDRSFYDSDEEWERAKAVDAIGVLLFTDWGEGEPLPDFGVEPFRKSNYVVLFSEESGNLDHAASFVQYYFKEKRPDGRWYAEVAFTCSRARPGQFGGAGVAVTADDFESIATQGVYSMFSDKVNTVCRPKEEEKADG